MLTDAQRAAVCAASRAYLGTPWQPQGRTKQGIDCVGLLVMAYRDSGFAVDEGAPDYRGIDPKRLMKTLTAYFDPAVAPQPADIVVYQHIDAGHLGLLLDAAHIPGRALNLIHSPAGGTVVEARFDPQRGKIRGIYTWRC